MMTERMQHNELFRAFFTISQASGLQVGGLGTPDLFVLSDFDKAVYYSSPSSSHRLALFVAAAFCFSKAAFETLRLLPKSAPYVRYHEDRNQEKPQL
jgi:hypothetical protein